MSQQQTDLPVAARLEAADAGNVSLQVLLDGGINAFACQLLSESFHTSAVLKAFPDRPVAFVVDGVRITLERVAEPKHPRIRRELGLQEGSKG